MWSSVNEPHGAMQCMKFMVKTVKLPAGLLPKIKKKYAIQSPFTLEWLFYSNQSCYSYGMKLIHSNNNGNFINRFMMFIYDHLESGSFRSCYSDTDSMCLALSKSAPEPGQGATKEEELRALFDPLIKPEMRASWEQSWKGWFVTTSTVEDRRCPGKLKGKPCLSQII